MSRRPRLSFAALLLLSAACSSSTDGPTTDGDGFAGESAGGALASAGATQAPAAGAGGAAGHAGSSDQSGNAGSVSGGFAGGLAGGGASAAGSGGHAVGSGGTSANGGAAGQGAGGSSGRGGGGGTSASGGAGGTSCPGAGHITYTLAKSSSPTATEQTAYDKIKTAMDKAISYYDCYTSITKSLSVSYVPSVETADGNINGSIRFGSNTTYMDYRSAMHEIGHTVGIGQASNWSSFIANGLFTGEHAAAQLNAINATLSKPLYTELHADTQHFWPYGLNQQSEVKSEADLIFHCQMVVAIRQDLGLK
ncbi:MAG TPA: hypothetical protein VHM25_08465 [Polyangiaceae bacterium]|jgi:hypothetical protein|nr:hypothetical protein [Polyangiaceae bacterium]